MNLNTAASGDMEMDLKNLQSKIMDLENKLSFTHSALEEGFELNNNVQINPTAFHSLNNEIINMKPKPAKLQVPESKSSSRANSV
jgi:hypothetical protein